MYNKTMKANLAINIAKDEYNKDLIIDLITIKDLLIAGNLGFGKSTLLHKIISTLISNNSPENLKLIMIDSSRVELQIYDGIPHLLIPNIFDPKKVILAMKWLAKEIIRRLDILKENKYRSIIDYDGKEDMPVIVLVIDELADFMGIYPKEIESVIFGIAQTGYIVGIHIILSTSRSNNKIITKSIRDSISTRIAMQNSSIKESRLIIGMPDAHNLHGVGDILYREGLKYPIRAQTYQINHDEVKAMIKSLKNKYKKIIKENSGEYESPDNFFNLNENNEILEYDNLYEEAKKVVLEGGKASTSYIQRKLGIGYSRSTQLIDLLEQNRVIGSANGAKSRKVYRDKSKE